MNNGELRHLKWKQQYQTNSIREKSIKPRISVIAAIDTEGEAYMSLSTASTDDDTFRLFVKELSAKLD